MRNVSNERYAYATCIMFTGMNATQMVVIYLNYVTSILISFFCGSLNLKKQNDLIHVRIMSYESSLSDVYTFPTRSVSFRVKI